MGKLFRCISVCLSALVMVLVLAACSMRPPALTEQEQLAKRDEFIAAGGYRIAGSYEIDSAGESWRRNGKALDTLMLAPRKPGTYPLIIYLPGLGEPADAGRLWREYWAKAGYAVLSVQAEDVARAFADLAPEFPEQPRADGAFDRLFGDEPEGAIGPPGGRPDKAGRASSQALLEGERRYIGRAFFTEESVQSRIEQLSWVYAQCRQRAAAKQGLFARADMSAVVLVGYDIGADTATRLLVGQAGHEAPEQPAFQPLAAMLISPVVAAAAGNLRADYRAIRLPLLALSSEQDSDSYGITTPELRRSVWDYAASRDKYLLLLKHARHAMFSGSAWSPNRHNGAGGEGRGLGPAGARPDFAGQFQGEGRRGGPPGGMGGMGGRPNRHDSPEIAAAHQQIGAVLSVSTAFFDSIVKNDNFAELWLQQNAPAWLKPVADLTAN